MARFSMDELRSFALTVLEDAAERSRSAPARSWGVRFALAFLANFTQDRGPFDWFWSSLATENSIGRSQNVNASLNGIYLALGLQRGKGDRRHP
jgi:hypothetical protein